MGPQRAPLAGSEVDQKPLASEYVCANEIALVVNQCLVLCMFR